MRVLFTNKNVWRSSLVLTVLSFLFLNSNAQGEQDFIKQSIIEQRIEAIASSMDETTEVDYTTLFEDLSYFYEHPLDLNKATVEQLQDLYLLNDLQILALQQHIETYGPLKSMYELQAVRLFDMNTIRMIQPFVSLATPGLLSDFTWKNFMKEGRSDLFLRYRRTVQEQAGYIPDLENQEPAKFLGSPDYMFTRYRFTYRQNVSIGLTMEKDAGEQLKKGPDFASAHLFVRNTGWLKTVAVGDFQAQFGQGLTFWSGLGFGKSPFVMNVKKNANGLRPYTSVNEGLFLRGVASTVKLGKFEITGAYSLKKMDANLNSLEDTLIVDDFQFASSIQISGFHRTQSEIDNRRTLTEQIMIGNASYNTRTFHVGVTATQMHLSVPVVPSNGLYQINKFSGNQNSNFGLDYQKVFRNFNFFGEVSRSQNNGYAAVNGLVAALNPRLSFSAVHRHFSGAYQSQNNYVNVFAESTLPQNERGLFLGLEALIAKGWTLSAYSDQIKYPWLRYQVQAPSNASDYLVQLSYKPDRKQEIYFRYRVRNGVKDLGATEGIDYPVGKRQQNFRVHAVYTPHADIQMRTRAEWNIYEKVGAGRNTGFLLYQDIIYKRLGSKVSFNLRYAVFNTPNYDTRIYAYESDVLYAFSIPGYYGKGSRAYVMMKWDITRGMDLWLRYAQWVYTDRTTISSGNTAIDGSKKGDVTVQLRWQF